MTEVFRLCDDYITRRAALDPVAAGMIGLSEAFGAATDYGPGGYAAREALIASTLAALGAAAVTSEADRLAAAFLRERLEAQLAWHRAGEPLRQLRAPIGQLSAIRDSVGPAALATADESSAEHRGDGMAAFTSYVLERAVPE